MSHSFCGYNLGYNTKMNNISDVLKQLSKCPLSIPRPTPPSLLFIPNTNPTKDLTETSRSTLMQDAANEKENDTLRKRKAPDTNLAMFSTTKSKNTRLDPPPQTQPMVSETDMKDQSSEYELETPSLLYLIEKVQKSSLVVCAYETGSRNYKRVEAVGNAIRKYDINHCFDEVILNNFFECLKSYNCFNAREITSVKRTLGLLHYEKETREKEMQREKVASEFNRTYEKQKEILPTGSKSELIKENHEIVTEGETVAQPTGSKSELTKEIHVIVIGDGESVDQPTGSKSKLTKKNHDLVIAEDERVDPVSKTCPICVCDFKEEDVWQHIILNHVEWERVARHKIVVKDTEFFCTHCFEKGFTTFKDMMKHETKIHGTNTENSCPFCGFTCHDIFEYYRHIVGSHGHIFQCPTCKEEFCHRNDLKFHMKLLCLNNVKADLRQRYFCPFCNSRFSSYEETVNHLFNKYNASKSSSDNIKHLYCFSCELTFETHYALELHLKHSIRCRCSEFCRDSNRHFQCFSCKEMFKSQEALEFHQSPKAKCLKLAPYTGRPVNFKSKIFNVTCDVKRLRRSDLTHYPKDVDSMLQSFEILHSPGKDKPLSPETSSVRDREESLSTKTAKCNTGLKSLLFYTALSKSNSTSNSQRKSETRKKIQLEEHKPKLISESDTNESCETSEEAACNSVPQYNTTPLTITDKIGTSVIMNNQHGGSNTIIQGNSCSVGPQMSSTQQAPQARSQNTVRPTHSKTDLFYDSFSPQACIEQSRFDRKLNADENAVVNSGVKTEKDCSSCQKCFSVVKESQVNNEQNSLRAFARKELGEKCRYEKDLHLNKAKQVIQDQNEIKEEIVTDEFRKYLESVQKETISAKSVKIHQLGDVNSGQALEPISSKRHSEAFISDRDSVQALYGIKSKPLEYTFGRNEKQLKSNVSQEKRQENDAIQFIEKQKNNELDSLPKNQLQLSSVSKMVFNSHETLQRKIKSEPVSPSSVSLVTDCHSSENLSEQVFSSRSSNHEAKTSIPLPKSATSQIHGGLQAKMVSVPDKKATDDTNNKSEPPHEHTVKILTPSSVFLPPPCSQQRIISGNSQQTILPGNVQQFIANLDGSAGRVRSKTVACLLRMKANSSYGAGLMEPSVSAASFLSDKGIFITSPTQSSGRSKAPTSKNDESENTNSMKEQSCDGLPVITQSLQTFTTEIVPTMSIAALSTAQTGLSVAKVSTTIAMSGQSIVTVSTSQALPGSSIATTSTTRALPAQSIHAIAASVSPAMLGISIGAASINQTLQGPRMATSAVPQAVSGQILNSASITQTLSGQRILRIDKVSTNQALQGPRMSTASVNQAMSGYAIATASVPQATCMSGQNIRTASAASALNCQSIATSSASKVMSGQSIATILASRATCMSGQSIATTSTSLLMSGLSKSTVSRTQTMSSQSITTSSTNHVLPIVNIPLPSAKQAFSDLSIGTTPVTLAVSQSQASTQTQSFSCQKEVKTAGTLQCSLATKPASPQEIGNNLQQKMIFVNQGSQTAVQQNPWVGNQVICPGLQQNFSSPVQTVQPGQILKQPQIFHQRVQTSQGTVVVPHSQYIMAGTGTQSSPVILVGQQQMKTTNSQNPSQYNLPGCQSNTVMLTGQQPLMTPFAGTRYPQKSLFRGTQPFAYA